MRRALFVAVFLLMAVSVSALSFQAAVFPSEKKIKTDETAVFQLEITHDSPVEELFEVYSGDVTWDVRATEVMNAPPDQKYTVDLEVRPLNLNPGVYSLPVTIKHSGADNQQKVLLNIELASPYAAELKYDISIFPSERNIKLDESAIFEVEVSHTSDKEQTFEVYSSDVTWDVRTEKEIVVPPGGKFKTNLIVRPLNVNPGAYNLPITFKRVGSQDKQRRLLYIELTSPFPDDASYLPAVRGIATVDPIIDPRNPMMIKLSLENQNQRNLENVEIKVRSNVINKDYTTTLGPLEKKTLTFDVNLDPLTPPQEDLLQISIIVPEKDKAYQFDLLPVPYSIISYGGVVPSVSTEKEFLKRIDTVTLTNIANKPLTHVYKVPAWFVKRWFISGEPDPKNVKGGVAWEIPMAAGGAAEVTVVYNYRPLFWILLVAAIIFGAYRIFRSPVAVRKRATVVTTHEGGITELKVVVELVNRGGKIARNVRVMDLAPRLADVIKDKSETMLAPSKVVPHEKSGTLVRWDIESMEPKEHRILTYRMKTKMQVLGGLTLPVTAVRFVIEGNERETVSNKPEIRYRS